MLKYKNGDVLRYSSGEEVVVFSANWVENKYYVIPQGLDSFTFDFWVIPKNVMESSKYVLVGTENIESTWRDEFEEPGPPTVGEPYPYAGYMVINMDKNKSYITDTAFRVFNSVTGRDIYYSAYSRTTRCLWMGNKDSNQFDFTYSNEIRLILTRKEKQKNKENISEMTFEQIEKELGRKIKLVGKA
jgi:hypothetical protein